MSDECFKNVRNCLKRAKLEPVLYLRSCLKVVWKLSVPEYILTFQTGEYCLRTASVRRGYSHTLNHMKTLNTFVETFFSPDSFGLAPPSFSRLSFGYESFTE